jgi:hypothetical protein
MADHVRQRPAASLPTSMRAAVAEADQALDTIKGRLDSLSEMGEEESLRLQMAMDRVSKAMSTLSNLLKRASDTDQQIIQNMK